MGRQLQFYADLEVTDIADPDVQRVLAELEEQMAHTGGPTQIAVDGRRIRLGTSYRENDPAFTAWLLQAVSQLVKHTRHPSVECLLCDSAGDWWSERVYPAA